MKILIMLLLIFYLEGERKVKIPQRLRLDENKLSIIIFLCLFFIFFSPLLVQAEGSDFIYHTVIRGECLWSICQQHQISINKILSFNNIKKSDVLAIGQVIKIPQSDLQSSDYFIHIVKKGETLWSISQRYNLTLNTIVTVNNFINSELISIGQQIRIPSFKKQAALKENSNVQTTNNNIQQEEQKKPITHIVKAGENLWNISQK